MRPATRHRCPGAGWPSCDRGDGRAPRLYCRACGTALVEERGLHGVFEWNREGRYPADKALALERTAARAQAAVDVRRPMGLVVRWVPEGQLGPAGGAGEATGASGGRP